MSQQPDFIRVQQEFAGHIKNPVKTARPKDVDDRHMKIYRDLFFNNVMGFLSGAFPVLAEIIGEQRWAEIGRDFFSRHNNKTPYFLEISREFLAYLEGEYKANEGDPVYLYELAHYEWLELYVDVEPEASSIEVDTKADILSSNAVLSPVVEGFLYQYPVHQISLENSAPEPKQSALIVYRKRDDSVGFVESNPFTLQLLTLLKQEEYKQEELTTEQLLLDLLQQSGLEGNQAAYQGGIEILKHWQELGIILGGRA
ncbi:hypothetical protein A9R00_07440 [Oleispira antarctica]|uniref:Uncharacterized protein n=1 Tax=Oleispira antarctica TaxID=188908 RepID=A0A1Y5HWA7_OLEAN|nr:hypothetical protein A9R00_07440 [Oleispira antarctica]